MKVVITLVCLLLIAVGFLGRPYIEMLQDGQSIECVTRQIKADISNDDSIKERLSAGIDSLSCRADSLLN